MFKWVPGSPLPVHAEISSTGKPTQRIKYSLYVPTQKKKICIYIHETTAVWHQKETRNFTISTLYANYKPLFNILFPIKLLQLKGFAKDRSQQLCFHFHLEQGVKSLHKRAGHFNGPHHFCMHLEKPSAGAITMNPTNQPFHNWGRCTMVKKDSFKKIVIKSKLKEGWLVKAYGWKSPNTKLVIVQRHSQAY